MEHPFPIRITLRLLVTATPTGSLSGGLFLGTFSNLWLGGAKAKATGFLPGTSSHGSALRP